MAGVAQDLGKNLRAVYTDSHGGISFEPIKENSSFNFSVLPILAFKNTPGFTGNVNARRMIILDSSSPAVNYSHNQFLTTVPAAPQA